VTLWTAPRPWKGKACHLHLRNEDQADLRLSNEGLVPADSWPLYTVFNPSSKDISLNAIFGLVHTDPRVTTAAVGDTPVRIMGEGVMSGLEDRRDHLPGRFIITKAIGLAVHLGASSILLTGTANIGPRAQRNLDTMARPLKGRRVRLFLEGAES
jgi:hypothetical protein